MLWVQAYLNSVLDSCSATVCSAAACLRPSCTSLRFCLFLRNSYSRNTSFLCVCASKRVEVRNRNRMRLPVSKGVTLFVSICRASRSSPNAISSSRAHLTYNKIKLIIIIIVITKMYSLSVDQLQFLISPPLPLQLLLLYNGRLTTLCAPSSMFRVTLRLPYA